MAARKTRKLPSPWTPPVPGAAYLLTFISVFIATAFGQSSAPPESAPRLAQPPPKLVDKIEFEFRDGPIRTMGVLGPSYLNVEALKQLQKRLAEPDHPRRHVFVILAFQDSDSEEWATRSPRPHGETFASWHRLYLEAAKVRSSRVARLVSMEGGTVVQTSEAGHVTTRVLEGQNPLLLSVEDVTLEIVEMEFIRLPSPIPPTKDGTNPLHLRVWAKASRLPTPLQAGAMLRALQRKFDNPRLSLNLREDGCFVYDAPVIWLPFAGLIEPPTWEEFSRSTETYCTAEFVPRMRCAYANRPTAPDAPY